MKKTVRAVVLAGGTGSRLWPLSRKQIPKQFLCLDGKETMLKATTDRIAPFCATENVIVVSSQEHVTGEAYHALQPYQVISEPVGRNTAPAIALAAAYLQLQDNHEDPIMLVLPADHVIQDIEAFHQAIERAIEAASDDYLVSFGILPTHADTGFGYIKAKTDYPEPLPAHTFMVEGFTEKPNRETAEDYLKEGGYFWNSGMFVWKASVLLDAIKKYLPEVDSVLTTILENHQHGLSLQESVDKVFEEMPNISIDYGVLEKVVAQENKLLVLPCNIQWNDVGSWDAVHEISPHDGNGNVTQGNAFAIDCNNSLLQSNHRLVAAVGLEDICLIETADAILLAKRGDTQRVKEVVEELKKRNATEHLLHLTVRRPWGTYTVLEEQPGVKIKRIIVNPGAALSLQRHQHRSEHWVVVSGTATVTCNNKTMIVTKNQSTYIPVGEKHRLENRGKIDVQLIEVQVGDYVAEDDIERFDDVYGR
ncbi:MAG: mannose-1-phosphate guanylyltransferase/mannose-6-phosphate isomerase [Methylococcales bacterium]|nr:mannose-1-phosphate guanylyltransferase/mannose-6-phosphate isomerase [Methylococcales bacterium]